MASPPQHMTTTMGTTTKTTLPALGKTSQLDPFESALFGTEPGLAGDGVVLLLLCTSPSSSLLLSLSFSSLLFLGRAVPFPSALVVP
jgi:hypothetical protein